MSRYTGPKNKLSRRESIDLFGKGIKMRRLNIPPGIHGHKSTGKKVSEYGIQLREKQKVKRFYGILEKQFRKYYHTALKQQGRTGDNLLRQLESRLDNLLVRSHIAPSRPMARQMIVHKHVQVDNHTVDRPSYQIKPQQIITFSATAIKIPAVSKLLENKEIELPVWIKKKGAAIQIQSLPEREQITEDFNEQAIVEHYSR
jgi:small subunit ribosomal protein S4